MLKNEGIYLDVWVDIEILRTTYIFACEGNLNRAFLEVSPSSFWGALIP